MNIVYRSVLRIIVFNGEMKTDTFGSFVAILPIRQTAL